MKTAWRRLFTARGLPALGFAVGLLTSSHWSKICLSSPSLAPPPTLPQKAHQVQLPCHSLSRPESSTQPAPGPGPGTEAHSGGCPGGGQAAKHEPTGAEGMGAQW